VSLTVALALVGMVETAAQQDPGRTARARSETVDTMVRFAWKGVTGLTEPERKRKGKGKGKQKKRDGTTR
jgi:hypothetical protein